MVARASTHRFEPEVQAGLDRLSKILRRPKNRLINEAVKIYIGQKSHEVEKELEDTLKALRAYRRKDPKFKRMIEEFVTAEAEFGAEDPAEGEIVTDEDSPRARIRRLLDA